MTLKQLQKQIEDEIFQYVTNKEFGRAIHCLRVNYHLLDDYCYNKQVGAILKNLCLALGTRGAYLTAETERELSQLTILKHTPHFNNTIKRFGK